MKVTDVKINGKRNPVGFHYDSVRVSWKLKYDEAQTNEEWVSRQSDIDHVSVQVSLTADFAELFYEKTGVKGDDLQQTGEVLDLRLQKRTRYYVRVLVTGQTNNVYVSETAYFETAKMDEPWQAKWITVQPEDAAHPVFVKTFSLTDAEKKSVGHADKKRCSQRAYISVGLVCFARHSMGQRSGMRC